MAAFEFLRFQASDVQIEPEGLLRMPRSARRTFEAIVEDGPISVAALRQATGLPSRTLRFGLHYLAQGEFVDSRRFLHDARTVAYFVHPSRILASALEAARTRAARGGQVGHAVEPAGPPRRLPLEPARRPRRPTPVRLATAGPQSMAGPQSSHERGVGATPPAAPPGPVDGQP